MVEFALKRRLFRKIAQQVASVEGAQALRRYLVSKIPPPFDGEETDDRKVWAFLRACRFHVARIPIRMLAKRRRELLAPRTAENFRLLELGPSRLALIVRFLIPRAPGGWPNPGNSIWKTRPKLLHNTGGLVSFVRLWRLCTKYQQNQEMNHGIAEIQADFESVELAVNLLTHGSEATVNKIARFKRLMDLVEAENDVATLKRTERKLPSIAADLHAETSQLQPTLARQHLRAVLRAAPEN